MQPIMLIFTGKIGRHIFWAMFCRSGWSRLRKFNRLSKFCQAACSGVCVCEWKLFDATDEFSIVNEHRPFSCTVGYAQWILAMGVTCGDRERASRCVWRLVTQRPTNAAHAQTKWFAPGSDESELMKSFEMRDYTLLVRKLWMRPFLL